MDAGHLFILRGDVRYLACDGWLLPWDSRGKVETHWRTTAPELADLNEVIDRARLGDLVPGAARVTAAEWRAGSDASPRPWLTDVGGTSSTPVDWYMEGVEAFLEAASEAAMREGPRYRRERPLLALPVVGTDLGGAERIKDEIVPSLVGGLQAAAARLSIDIALVTWTWPMFSAAQAERARLIAGSWPAIDDLATHSSNLASEASRGNLVLFVGSGASVASGLPDWKGLLRQLAALCNVDPDDPKFEARSPLDKAQILARRMRSMDDGGTTIGAQIAKLLTGSHISLLHFMLASLPSTEIVTTNYDTLLERACASIERPVRVLPHRPSDDSRRWLLKLHGSLEQPDDIVLTRDDYSSFGDQHQALAGIVHGLLMTRHMLFVGFSLDDPNFAQIVNEVRKVLRPTLEKTGEPMGTALLPNDDWTTRELWNDEVCCVAMAAEKSAASHRRTEIFVDRLVGDSWPKTGHLLDEDFTKLLAVGDNALRRLLIDLQAKVWSGSARESSAWPTIERLLRDLGSS